MIWAVQGTLPGSQYESLSTWEARGVLPFREGWYQEGNYGPIVHLLSGGRTLRSCIHNAMHDELIQNSMSAVPEDRN